MIIIHKKKLILTSCGGTPAINVMMCVKEFDHFHNYYVVGTDCNKYHLYLANLVDKKFLVPRAEKEDYIDKLNEIVEGENIDLVHVQSDVEVSTVSENREKLKTIIFFPDKKTVELCHNKYKLIKFLNEHDIPSAKTILVKNENDIKDAFIKFGSKIWLRATRGAGGKGSLPVQNLKHAIAWVDYHNGWGNFVAEEYLGGRNIAWQGLYKNGELITSLVWERLEYLMKRATPSGISGTPSVARIIEDGQVDFWATTTISEISKKPNGIFSVDFRENDVGLPCVTEINPARMFTPSYMYCKAGVNLVEIYLKLAFGEEIQEVPKYNSFKQRIVYVRGIDVEPVWYSY